MKKIVKNYFIYNKIIQKLFVYLLFKKIINKSFCLLNKIIKIISCKLSNKSPFYIIERAIFNMLIPIKVYSSYIYTNKYKIKGVFLQKSIFNVLKLIINYSKENRRGSISYKIAIILIQIYKKEHILYKNKVKYFQQFNIK